MNLDKVCIYNVYVQELHQSWPEKSSFYVYFASGCTSTPLPCPFHQVVDQIDTLTSDLQLEDEMTDSSKTDTLNSSSSGTTASSIEKIKVQANAPLIKPPAHPSAILTVLRKPNPPPPPPRLTPVKCEEPPRVVPTVNPVKTNGTLLRNGGLPGRPNKIPNGDICCIPNSNLDKAPMQSLMHRPEKDRSPQAGPRERVRFNEKVQYHGYCPDCESRYNIKNREVHLHSESVHPPGKLPHQGPPFPPPPHLPTFPLENGGLGISHSNSFPPPTPAAVPPPTAPKPQKTILRKSTTTTVWCLPFKKTFFCLFLIFYMINDKWALSTQAIKKPKYINLHSTKWHKNHLVSMPSDASVLDVQCLTCPIIRHCRIMRKDECILSFAIDLWQTVTFRFQVFWFIIRDGRSSILIYW